MSNITTLSSQDPATLPPEVRMALSAHKRVELSQHMVVDGLMSLCEALKDIRDYGYFWQLGYTEFGEYTEAEHGIGARQAYNYIRVYEECGAEFLNSNSKLGITKLLAIASLNTDERQELMQEHTVDELADMSTAEVKRLTEQVKHLEEQLSMFESEKLNLNSNSKTSDIDESELRAQIEQELKEQYVEQAAEVEKKAKAESDSEISRLKSELKQVRSELKMNNDTVKLAEARAKEAEDRAKIAEDKAAQANDLELKFKNAEAEKAAMEKQIRLSSDPELTRFKFMFESWQSATAALFDQLGKLDEAMQEKMRSAVKVVIGDQL